MSHSLVRSDKVRRSTAIAAAPQPIPSIVHEVLRSSGQPLDVTARAFMEPRFGHDFSQVRVHADDKAAESARAVNALAYTVGGHIVFGAGRFAPGTQSGQRLLAHELTHVAQQRESAGAGALRIGDPTDLFEQSAEQVAGQVIQESETRAPSVSNPGKMNTDAPILQRQPSPSVLKPRELELGSDRFAASLAGSITLYDFASKQSDLTKDQEDKLASHTKTILRLLDRYPASFISIIGHTDAVGQEEDNKALGQKRADAVLASLATAGVPTDAMHTGSVGETVPLVSSKNAEPRNRRVDIVFHARSLMSGVFTERLTIFGRTQVPTLEEIKELSKPVQLTLGDLDKIINDPKRKAEEQDLARILKDYGAPQLDSPGKLEEWAKKIQKHVERNVGDYTIKPDYKTIFGGLKDLAGF